MIQNITKTILIDLRGLNFVHITGINTYSLHFLWCLKKVIESQNLINYKVVGIGLLKQRQDFFSENFSFFKDLFSSHISLKQYLPIFFPFNFSSNSAVINGVYSIQQTYGTNLINNKCVVADFLIQTQPKALPRHAKTKRIVAFHDVFSVYFPEFSSFKQRIIENKKLYKNLAKDASYVISNSFTTAADIQNLANLDYSLEEKQEQNLNSLHKKHSQKIHWIYPALPSWKFLESGTNGSVNTVNNKSNQHQDLPDFNLFDFNKNKYFLVLSGCERRKNWINILKAFADFYEEESNESQAENNRNQDLYLVFAGPIVDKNYWLELQKYIQKYNLKNIIFTQKISEFYKTELLKNATAFVYPSLYEGFGFPILEAFLHQVPVITSTVGSMPEISSNSALLVNPLRFEEIKIAMQMIVDNPDLAKKLVLKASKRLKDFEWDEMQNGLKNILEKE